MGDENLLIFEGMNERHVFGHLFNRNGIAGGIIEFKDMNGFPNLLKALPTALRSNKVKRLGVVVDADLDISSRWQSIRNILINRHYENVPTSLVPEGTIVELEDIPVIGVPKVGVWIMPDNQLPGMLEHFVSFLGATSDPLWSIADNCLNDIPNEHRHFTENHRIKAHIHTWLAWQEEPGTPLGSAINKRYFDATAPHAQNLIAWIRRLFEL